MPLDQPAYTRLLTLRTGLRQFLHWSEEQAQAADLTPAQHQLLLAIRGHPDPRGPTVGQIAGYLLLQHHSAVGLIDRAEAARLVTRHRDPDDHRQVRLQLSGEGARRIEVLSALHLEELDRLARQLPDVWKDLLPVSDQPEHGQRHAGPVTVHIARVYDAEAADAANAYLVDRLWPRGLARVEAPFSEWLRDLAPSTELRVWYGHVPERFAEFSRRYRRELGQPPAAQALAGLRRAASDRVVTLLTATRDLDHSGAAVLRDVLADH